MKKRVKIMGIAAVMAAMLAGCGTDFPDMTDEQASVVGEYAAITLLKYDVNNRSRLVDLEKDETITENFPTEPESQTVPEEQEESVEPPIVPETPVIEIGARPGAGSFESFYELPEGITVIYSGQEICQSYSGDDNNYFSLDAAEGKSLLVLHFVLHNASASEQSVDFLNRKDTYQITVNSDYTRVALPTLLTNDVSSYRGTIEAGSSKEVVLLVEIGLEQAQNLTSIVLNLKNESNTYTIQLL